MEVATRSRSGEEMLERRSFLGALTGASLGVLSEGIFTEFARAQNTAQAGATLADQISFETSQVEVSDNTIFLRRYGKGPAILLLRGFPRTRLIPNTIAPTRKRPGESNARCCIYGPRVARSILSTQKTGVRSPFAAKGLPVRTHTH